MPCPTNSGNDMGVSKLQCNCGRFGHGMPCPYIVGAFPCPYIVRAFTCPYIVGAFTCPYIVRAMEL